jgi:hypothetical protein
VAAASNSGRASDQLTKSARLPLLAMQNLRPRPQWPAAAHFGVYFRGNIWDKLRRIAGQVRPAPPPANASRLSMARRIKLESQQ